MAGESSRLEVLLPEIAVRNICGRISSSLLFKLNCWYYFFLAQLELSVPQIFLNFQPYILSYYQSVWVNWSIIYNCFFFRQNKDNSTKLSSIFIKIWCLVVAEFMAFRLYIFWILGLILIILWQLTQLLWNYYQR